MQSSQEIIQNKKPIAIEEVNKKPIAIAIDDKHIDLLLKENHNLICQEFKGWYAKVIKSIGSERFTILAKTAEQEGKNPARYFSYLLKRELNNA